MKAGDTVTHKYMAEPDYDGKVKLYRLFGYLDTSRDSLNPDCDTLVQEYFPTEREKYGRLYVTALRSLVPAVCPCCGKELTPNG